MPKRTLKSRAQSFANRKSASVFQRRELAEGFEAGHNAAVRDLRKALQSPGLSKVLDLAYGPSVEIRPDMLGCKR